MNMNRGALALRAVGSVRQIAEGLGLKSPSQVHRWCTGQEVPSVARRAQIAAKWPHVRVELWDLSPDAEEAPARVEVVPVEVPAAAPVEDASRRPEEAPARVEVVPAAALVEDAPQRPEEAPARVAPSDRRVVLAEAEAQVERLRAMQADAARSDTAMSVRVAIERELRAALAQLAEMRGELSPSDETRILSSRAWERIVEALTTAVRDLPDRCTRGEVAAAIARALDSDAGAAG